MGTASEIDTIPEYPLDVDMTAFSQMVKILNALGNEDALAIFLYANEGITSSKNAIQALGLTQKKFYSRLKDLLDNNLLEKDEGEYKHTILGKIIFDVGLYFENLLKNQDKLKIMSQVSKVKNLSEKEMEELMQAFSINISPKHREVRIIDSFEELVSTKISIMENAEDSIMMAIQNIDNRVINTVFSLVEKGVKIRGIFAEAEQFSQVLKVVLSILSNPKQVELLTSYLKSPDFQIRFTKIQYTFLIADGKDSIVEIKNPLTDQFKFAFIIYCEDSSKALVEVFESLWEKADEIEEKMKF